ncbi:PREDICTED: cytochrome c oxidase subunit 6A1, mitochondrial-like [Amphimedon queenslandica]|uniref:Cytochrome c oxidase subunit n=1 Tax=Amphimedon queenslandica TaxID=400682 RepID=A0A1X7UZA6_AMPQE|nr:PREDICTED: cytochrome c oxidase subunit 6A1, mitochondrial-like [Amphimedon queenslandica]|eukprot:XP_003386284.1 PREDICTED: cytochrome c oxidase subunit 6A1, mitochondrial-like [Amphimedon queenslandica]
MAAVFLRSSSRLISSSLWKRGSPKSASNYAQMVLDGESHAVKTTTQWKLISLLIAVPGMLFVARKAYRAEQDHHHHIEEHGRPEFLPYPHLRIRSKPFPWGDGNHSLFHNPETNALPEGYED